MEIIEIKNLTFQYPDMQQKVLNNVSLNIREGEFSVICGPSGCGKTTLLRLLKKEIEPVGMKSGEIIYSNKPLVDWDDRKMIEEIGFVFQDPENQIIMDDVMQELVFSLENLGYSNLEMRKRVAEMVHAFGLEDLLEQKPSELSGGQKQMLNLISVLLLKPKVLLLDEPTSQLDPVAAKDLILMLERLNKEMGITIVLVEHRLEELFSVADRVYMMNKGQIVYEGTSNGIISEIYQQKDDQFTLYIPAISRLYMEREAYPVTSNIPVTVKEAKAWIVSLKMPNIEKATYHLEHADKELLFRLKDVYYQYSKHTSMVLKNLSLDIHKGDYYAVIGGNGSGKTTLLKACLGLIKPQRGTVQYLNKNLNKIKDNIFTDKVAYLPQNPRTYFIQDTIEKELKEAIIRKKIENGEAKMDKIMDVFDINHLRNRHPYDCSGGEMQKAALACMILSEPEILFIDEPTKGMDPVSKQHFASILKELNEDGLTIVMVTHDIEFAAKHVNDCAMMFDGSITVEGKPNDLFKGNYFYTTAINRATQNSVMPEVLTLEEALETWSNHVHT